MASAAALAIAISTTGTQQANQALASTAQGVTGVGRAASGITGALSNMANIAGGMALGAGITQLPGLLMDFAKGAADDEQATMRLKQSLRNLGGDFDANLDKVNRAIDAGQKLAFSDDDVRDSFQFLAAATGDADEALRRQQAAMDLARGANLPLAQATKMLGKMNAENLEVFKKLGITIGDNATEADALAAVQKKFGGQSAEYAKSTAGQFEQAKLALSETEEAIGNALLPILTGLGQTLAEVLPKVQEFVGHLADLVGPALKGALEVIGPFIDALGTMASGDYAGAVGMIGQAISDLAPKIGTALLDWGQQFVAWVVPAATAMVLELAKVELAAINWIADQVPGLQTKLLEWAAAFADWIGTTAVPTIERELPKVAAALVTFLQNEAAPTAAKVIQAFAGFWTWIATDAVPMIQKELPKVGDQLAAWLVDSAIPWAATNLPKLGETLIVGIVAGLSGAWAGKLSPWLKGLVSGEGGGASAESILGVLNAANPLTLLSGFAGSIMAGLYKGLFDRWGGTNAVKGVKSFFTELPQSIVDSVGNVDNLLVATGTSILASLGAGLNAGLESLRSTVTSIVNAIPEWIRNLLDQHSPSNVMFDIGVNTMEGLRLGMLSKLGPIDELVASLSSRLGGVAGVIGGVFGGGDATGSIADYIRQSAAAHRIDPSVALAVAMSEGGVSSWNLPGDQNTNGVYSSFGPYQLHYGGLGYPHSAGGLGDVFTAITGLHASNASAGPAAIDFALAQAHAGGWGPWHGWKGAQWAGIYDQGGYLPVGASLVVNRTGRPEPVLTPDQLAGLKSGGNTYHVHVNDPHHGTNIKRLVRDAIYELQREQRGAARLGI